ncbi:MAG: family 16 glycosylhydrolase [Bacteroidota bacterium]
MTIDIEYRHVKNSFLLFLVINFLWAHVARGQGEILVWSDEFNVDGTPNPAYWGYDLGTGNGWGNNEVQNYTNNSQNVRIENGILIIEAIKSGGTWTSARMKSQGKKNFKYGKIVFRAKLPTGTGTWPALWMLGENISSIGWPACGEIDVMEHVGKDPGVVHGSLHSSSSFGATVNTGVKTVSTFNTEFHTYEALWTEEKIQFSIDGTPFYTYQPAVKNSSTWPFNTPFFIIMNIAMGGNFGGPIDASLTQARLEVDYVRVYEPLSGITLDGPNIVEKNQTGIKFKTNTLDGASYQWTLPEGAQIVSGEGTSEITVNWGQFEGEVKVKVTLDAQVFENSVQVTHVVKPQGSVFPMMSSPDFGIEWTVKDNQNFYTLSYPNEQLQINYTLISPQSNPSLAGKLHRAVDLTQHPVLRVRAKTLNKSSTLNMRVDLVDNDQKATNKSPVFNFTPLIDDGEFYDYRFNYETQNQWQSAAGSVNETRITQLNLYLTSPDFGIDSLWIEDVWVEQAGAATTPNRPSHLNGNVTNGKIIFAWRDNADNEQGFEIHRSATKNGTYTLLNTSASGATSATVDFPGDDPLKYFYKILSFNASGKSMFSNTYDPQVITASEAEQDHAASFYPNPSPGSMSVRVSRLPAVLRILTVDGSEIMKFQISRELSELDVSYLAKGIYFVEILSRSSRSVEKLILQ